VNAGSFYFTPNNLTINIGDTVFWINDGGNHNVNGDISTITGQSFGNPEAFSSSSTNVVGDTIYTHIFNIAGQYDYDCSIGQHAANGMVGAINVLGDSTSSTTVFDVISEHPFLQSLELAIVTAGLDTSLNNNGPFTVFAPSDDVFAAIDSTQLQMLLANTDVLTAILANHVHLGTLMASDLTDGLSVSNLLGSNLTVTNDGISIMIDDATIIFEDLVADNGVVHIIDMILIPNIDTTLTVMDIIDNSPMHTTLSSAINAANLGEALSGDGPYTVFAPTNDAFDNLPAGTLDALLADLPQLTAILKHHVHGGLVMSADLTDGMTLSTLNDDQLSVSVNGLIYMIDLSTIIAEDLEASNGVVHIIDMVLIPSDPSTISEHHSEENVKYLYTLNLLGEKIDPFTNDKIVIDVYSNGKTIKRYNWQK
jgi:uncharacterized surface protein with fasciclin (FAS1) repeats